MPYFLGRINTIICLTYFNNCTNKIVSTFRIISFLCFRLFYNPKVVGNEFRTSKNKYGCSIDLYKSKLRLNNNCIRYKL